MDAGKDYNNFSGVADGKSSSVKFIIKTEGVKSRVVKWGGAKHGYRFIISNRNCFQDWALIYMLRQSARGALLSRIDKVKLALGLLVCGVYQLIVLLVGYVLTIWLRGSYLADKGEALNPLISMVIFVAFAIKMLKNALEK